MSGSGGSTSNEFHGDAANLIQARDVTINQGPGPQRGPARLLRSAPRHFVNREPGIARLDAKSLERVAGGPPVAVINGQGGVGKSALGIHWAYEREERFPDGHLYADLGGLSAHDRAGLGEVLGRFLRALVANSKDIPADHDDRAGMYRSATKSKKLLVLLDNVETPGQIKDLLPGSADCMVIATSDRRLGGMISSYGAEVIKLQPLDRDAGLRLLTKILGPELVDAEPVAASELVDLCDGLPLALRIAGGQLAARPELSIGWMVEELSRGRQRLERLVDEDGLSVKAACDAAYRDLPEDAARMFHLLSSHPGFDARPGASGGRARPVVFCAGVAGALAETGEREAGEVLRLLADRYLIEPCGAGRYEMRGLIGEYARRQADGAEPVRRAVEWYLRQAVVADYTVNPHRTPFGPLYSDLGPSPYGSGQPGKAAALDWLDLERSNLAAAVYTSAQRGWDDLACQLCEALWGLYLSRKGYDDWIATHSDGLAAARRLRDPRWIFRMCIQLGRARYESGSFAQALDVLEEGLDAARQTGDPLNEATAREFIGRSHLDAGACDRAVPYLTEALWLESEGDRIRGVALDSHHLGRARLGLGHYEAAIADLTRAYSLFDRDVRGPGGEKDLYNLGRVSISLGEVLIRVGRPGDAREPLLFALRTMREEKRTFQVALAQETLAHAAEAEGDEAVALSYARQAVEAYSRVGSPRAQELHTRYGDAVVPGQADRTESRKPQ